MKFSFNQYSLLFFISFSIQCGTSVSYNSDILPYKPSLLSSQHEKEVKPFKAISKTKYTWGFLMWSKLTYLPNNALSSSEDTFWQSAINVIDDFWEALFKSEVRIDSLYIKWKYPPKHFKVFYKQTNSNKYIPISHVYTISSEESTSKKGISHYVSFSQPITTNAIRISLNTPQINNVFGITNVKFYQIENDMMIINDGEEQLCLFVNKIHSLKMNSNEYMDSNIFAYSCSKVLSFLTNNELFLFDNINNRIVHRNTNLCLSLNRNRDITLNQCDEKTEVIINSKISFHHLRDEYLYIDNSNINFIDSHSFINSSSTFPGYHYRVENIMNNDDTVWMSNVGDKEVSLVIFFEEEHYDKIIDRIDIYWIRSAKRFKVFTMTSTDNEWVMKYEVKNNNQAMTTIIMYDVIARGVMIRMDECNDNTDIGNVYAIRYIYIGFNGYPLRYGKGKRCFFQYVNQFNIDNNKEELLYQGKGMIRYYKEFINEIKKIKEYYTMNKSNTELSNTINKVLNSISIIEQRIGEKYRIYLKDFDMINQERKIHNKENYRIKGTQNNPGYSCYDIKKTNSFFYSGFFYIIPECYEESPFEVYCDYLSSNNNNIIILKNQQLQKCYDYGLFPAEFSSNQSITINKKNINTITCSSFFNDNFSMEIECSNTVLSIVDKIENNIDTIVECPNNCDTTLKIKQRIYYENNIPICSAGITSRVINKEKGGKMIIRKEENKFMVKKYIPKCASKQLSSFIEITNEDDEYTKDKAIEKMKETFSSVQSSMNSINDNTMKEVKNLNEIYSNFTSDENQKELDDELTKIQEKELEVEDKISDEDTKLSKEIEEIQSNSNHNENTEYEDLTTMNQQTTSSVIRDIKQYHHLGYEYLITTIKTKIESLISFLKEKNYLTIRNIEPIRSRNEELLKKYKQLKMLFLSTITKGKMTFLSLSKNEGINLKELKKVEKYTDITINSDSEKDINQYFSSTIINKFIKNKKAFCFETNLNEIILLKGITVKDFLMKITVYIEEKVIVVFQYKNHMNYDYIVFDSFNHSIFVKCKQNGIDILLREIKTVSFQIKKWNNIIIKVNNQSLYINLNEKDISLDITGIDKIYQQIGFIQSNVNFHSIEIKHINKAKHQEKFLSPLIQSKSTIEYVETFRKPLELSYSLEGTKSDWRINHQFKRIEMRSNKKSLSMILLKKKILSFGKYTIRFKLLSEIHSYSYVSIIFNYKSNKEYLLLNISESSISLFDSSKTLLAKSYNESAINFNLVNTIVVESNEENYDIYFNKKLLFSYETQFLQLSQVGLGGSLCDIAFTYLSLSPLELQFTDNDKQFIINSKNQKHIILPDINKINKAYLTITSNKTSLKEKISFLNSVIGNINIITSSSSEALTSLRDSFNIEKEKLIFLYRNDINKCSLYKTFNSRELFCLSSFKSDIEKEKCNKDFCSSCCSYKITSNKENIIHYCTKKCNKQQILEENNDDINNIDEICFNNNGYLLCNNLHENLIHDCRIDMCKLCCSSLEKMKNIKFSFSLISQCNNKCENLNKTI